tara:strand:- start:24233 stop:24907 length:675 start_codon:yes stop_codon:yes gene_type:complete
MNDNKANTKNIFNQLGNIIKTNIRYIITLFSIIFLLFISFQFYNFYNSNKIQNNSIDFFSLYSLDSSKINKDLVISLSKEKNFYGILSKLELIDIYYSENNFQNIISLYKELLSNNKLAPVYKTAIATKASYNMLNINFDDMKNNYSETIKDFISHIDENLIAYQGIKLELNYLSKILEIEMNNDQYKDSKEILKLYDSIITSEIVSNAIKERIKKIHEFYIYK